MLTFIRIADILYRIDIDFYITAEKVKAYDG